MIRGDEEKTQAAAELVSEAWLFIRDRVRQLPGFHLTDGDGSIGAIGESAYAVATVLFPHVVFARRTHLAPAAAAAALAGAARLVLAGDAEPAARLAAMARDIFGAWWTGDTLDEEEHDSGAAQAERERQRTDRETDAELLAMDQANMLATWNARCPPGTRVAFRDVSFGPEYETTTRGKAWALGHGEPVVLIEGRVGGHCLRFMRALADGETAPPLPPSAPDGRTP